LQLLSKKDSVEADLGQHLLAHFQHGFKNNWFFLLLKNVARIYFNPPVPTNVFIHFYAKKSFASTNDLFPSAQTMALLPYSAKKGGFVPIKALHFGGYCAGSKI
jgi:hypothetical protein